MVEAITMNGVRLWQTRFPDGTRGWVGAPAIDSRGTVSWIDGA